MRGEVDENSMGGTLVQDADEVRLGCTGPCVVVAPGAPVGLLCRDVRWGAKACRSPKWRIMLEDVVAPEAVLKAFEDAVPSNLEVRAASGRVTVALAGVRFAASASGARGGDMRVVRVFALAADSVKILVGGAEVDPATFPVPQSFETSISSPVSQLCGPQLDPKWTYVDKAGHRHAAVDGRTPTLKAVDGPEVWCDDCGDMHPTESWLECELCGERISPSHVQGSYYLAGRTTAVFNGVGIDPDSFGVLAEWCAPRPSDAPAG